MSKSNEEVFLTKEGLAKLEEELRDLKTVKRKELAARLKLAISYGDLKENSEYHSAKEDQSFMETRIMILEKMLTKAQIVDSSKMDLSAVSVGCIVILNDVEYSEKSNIEWWARLRLMYWTTRFLMKVRWAKS